MTIMRRILSMLLLFGALTANAKDIKIDTNDKAQTIEGWGVSLCWWAHMCGSWSDEHIDELVDWLVSPEGLNYNIFRYNIGGGDDPMNYHCELHHMGKGKGIRAEIPGYKIYADSPYDWNADWAQVKIMLKIRERRPDAIFEAFSNSAPWWMTISGCCGGNADAAKDNLRKDYYDDFARYLVDVCKYMKDAYGIEFRTLEPFNESLSNYWPQNGSQEGCHFDAETQVAVVKVVYEELKRSGLKTVISASDETDLRSSLEAFDAYGEAMDMVGQWNTHTYSANDEQRRLVRDKAKAKGIRLWQSETGSGGKGIDGNLNMLQRLFDDVNIMQPAAWCDWQFVEDKGDQWCMVIANWKTEEYHKVKPYPIRQQVTRFIRDGYTILNTSDKQTLAAVSADKKTLVIVSLNNTDSPVSKTYLLPKGFKAKEEYLTDPTHDLAKMTISGKGKVKMNLPARAVKTIIFETH